MGRTLWLVAAVLVLAVSVVTAGEPPQGAPYLGMGLGQVVVTGVTEGAPADKAGFKVHDLIVALDGTGVGTTTEVANIFAAKKVGDVVAVDVKRAGQNQTIKVTLGERPEAPQGENATPYVGMGLGQLVVLGVTKDSPADKAGFQVDDLILTFDGAVVVRTTDVVNLLAKKKAGDEVAVEIQRAGQKQTIKVTLGQR